MNNFDPKRYIEVPADKVRDACRAAYDLSVPVGLGFLHFREGELDDETLDQIVDSRWGPSMDYVHGRQCKFWLRQHDGRYFLEPDWYDHTHEQLVALLTKIGIEDPEGQIAAAKAACNQAA